MKKNFIQMFAACLRGFAILAVCGLTTTVLTSCGDDDDDNKSNPQPEQPAAEKKYDITLTFFTYKTIAAYVDCEFTYTDHNGKKSTPVTITGNENGENLTAQELTYYQSIYKLKIEEKVPESKFLEYKAFHYTIKDVPEGSTISYETIQHTAQGATAPTEAFSYVHPCVMVTWKSGNAVRNRLNIGTGIVGADKLDRWFEAIIQNKEGNTMTYATGSIVAGSNL
jgi:hypothetical protein